MHWTYDLQIPDHTNYMMSVHVDGIAKKKKAKKTDVCRSAEIVANLIPPSLFLSFLYLSVCAKRFLLHEFLFMQTSPRHTAPH